MWSLVCWWRQMRGSWLSHQGTEKAPRSWEQLCLSRDWGQEFMATRLPEAHRWDDPERALVTTPWEHSPIHSTSRHWGNVCCPFWAHWVVPCLAWANPLVLWWPGARELSQQMPWQLIWGLLLSVFIAIYPALWEQINAQAGWKGRSGLVHWDDQWDGVGGGRGFQDGEHM